MLPVQIVTDNMDVGSRLAIHLKQRGYQTVEVIEDGLEGCVAFRAIVSKVSVDVGAGYALLNALSAWIRAFGDSDSQFELRFTGEPSPTLRVEVPTSRGSRNDLKRTAIATATQYRLSVWGDENVAHAALRPLKNMKFDYELGPSKWPDDQQGILYGGAPEDLIDEIVWRVKESTGITLSKNNCWGLENREIRVLILPLAFSIELRRQIGEGKYTKWALDLTQDQLKAVYWAAGVVGAERAVNSAVDEWPQLGSSTRVKVGLRAIQLAVHGRPVTLRELKEAITHNGFNIESDVSEFHSPPLDNLKNANWMERLTAQELLALLWAIGEVGYRASPERENTRFENEAIPSRITIGLVALHHAVLGSPWSFDELSSKFVGTT